MKKIVVLAVAGLALASVAAYAQMQHQGGSGMQMPQGQGSMMMQDHMMQSHMRGQGMMGSGIKHGDMSEGHGNSAQPKEDTSPSSLAFRGINLKMHQKMDIAFTGDADADFVKGMIRHHQGAVDMAKTVIAFGKDPEVKKLAEEVIKAQECEIAFLQNWLKNNSQ
jgi:uncharacterized protein (DUF305 family)